MPSRNALHSGRPRRRAVGRAQRIANGTLTAVVVLMAALYLAIMI